MHKDIETALIAAGQRVSGESPSISFASRAVGYAYLKTFLYNLPNHSDTVNGTGCWYPARILAELTEEKEDE